MTIKKAHSKHPVHHKHAPSRHVRIREVLITLVFGSLILVFLALTMINATTNY